MPLGEGKYDLLCTIVREATNAKAAIVIIVGGSKGNGFSMQSLDPQMVHKVPDMLENVAKQMREALEQGRVP